MQRRVIGSMAIGLALSLTGCASSSDRALMTCDCPTVPQHLTNELLAPSLILDSNRGLLLLLAEYEALRRRANADRVAVVEIIGNGDRGTPTDE